MGINRKALAEDVCVHIFTVSAAMLGVCITVIGLIRVVITVRRADTFADDIVAVDTLFFLVSCLLSYWALRTRSDSRMFLVERVADFIFMLGLGLMAVASFFIAYSITAA